MVDAICFLFLMLVCVILMRRSRHVKFGCCQSFCGKLTAVNFDSTSGLAGFLRRDPIVINLI